MSEDRLSQGQDEGCTMTWGGQGHVLNQDAWHRCDPLCIPVNSGSHHITTNRSITNDSNAQCEQVVKILLIFCAQLHFVQIPVVKFIRLTLKFHQVTIFAVFNYISLRSRILLEKLTVTQPVKKFSVFYGTGRYIIVLNRARH